MPNIIWSLSWRLFFVFGYPLGVALRSANAGGVTEPEIVTDFFEKIAQTHTTSLIIGACIAFWFTGAVIGALYPTPDEMKTVEISAGLRMLICLAGGFAAFLWVLNGDGALNLLTPLWVGGVAFVAPHLIQIVPSVIKSKIGLGGKS